MINRILSIFIFISFIFFSFFIIKYYFSEKNIISTNKTRSSYKLTINEDIDNLPTLKNDTNDIIIYKNDVEEFKEKSKKRFWEKLISNE